MPKKKDKTHISIRGVIGWDDTAIPSYLARKLEEAKGAEVQIDINSPGGDLYDGLEMANMLRNYEGHITARITGLAASAASYIPMMADTVEAMDNAVFMIHNPYLIAIIDYSEAEKLAGILEKMAMLLVRAYAAKTNKSETEILDLMNEETFFFGEEIKDEGFADIVIENDGTEDNSKTKALAFAGGEIKACLELLKESKPKAASLDKIAACMGQIKTLENPEEKMPEPKTQTLQEFLESNPEAKAEHEKTLADAKAETENVAEALKMAAPIISGDYPDSVKAHITGLAQKEDLEGVKAYMAMHEATLEALKEQAAIEEQDGETTPGGPTNDSSDGVVTEASQIKGAVARLNSQFGIGGNN